MSSLVSDLLAVLSDSSVNATASRRRDTSTTSDEYRQIIESNAEQLNTLAGQSTTASKEIRVGLVCAVSRLLFGDNTIAHGSSSYTTAEQENWSSTCWLPAACFIKIMSPLELALTLKFITVMQTTFAVRSAGHNPNPTWSSVGANGVLLDLSALNEIVLSSDKSSVSVGPGATWDQVFKSLEAHNLTAVGGRVAGVGVGGLLLGGGMSHFSNYWGQPADSVENFEVVLANSQIVNANANENADLFKALKGGGPNFGIVTRFDLKTYPDYQVWYTFRVYGTDKYAEVLEAATRIEASMANDPTIGFFLSASSGALVAGLVHLGWVEEHPAAYDPLYAITPLMVAVPETKGTAYSVSIAAEMPGIANREIAAVSVAVDLRLFDKLFAKFQSIVASTSVSSGYSLAYTIQPIAPSSVQQSQARGGNSLGVLSESQAWLALVVQWTDTGESTLAASQLGQLYNDFRSIASATKQLLSFEFMNDSGYIQSPLQSYGISSLSNLEVVAKKYDPSGVFQKLQNGGFLLSKA